MIPIYMVTVICQWLNISMSTVSLQHWIFHNMGGFLFEIFPKPTRWSFLLKPIAMVLNTAKHWLISSNSGTQSTRMHQTIVFSLKKWHPHGWEESKQPGHICTSTQNKWVAPPSEQHWHWHSGGGKKFTLHGKAFVYDGHTGVLFSILESNPNLILCLYWS